jgi:hypothetical protein
MERKNEIEKGWRDKKDGICKRKALERSIRKIKIALRGIDTQWQVKTYEKWIWRTIRAN